MLKKLLFFIVLSYLSMVSFQISSAEIIPLKKPLQTKEEKEKKLLIDVLKPLSKPVKKTETKKTEEKIIVFGNNFHGRTTTIISFSNDTDAKNNFGPYTPGFISVEYPCF